MSTAETGRVGVEIQLNELLAGAGMDGISPREASAFDAYLHLLTRWNIRTNLTSIRDEEGILRRHFVESIFCARALPSGVRSLLDFGSGAGFPGIPIALLRSDIAVTLAESQGKKAAFLLEAARVLGAGFVVHGSRAEELEGQFDCVTLRAVDHMTRAIGVASNLIGSGGFMALLTTRAEMTVLELSAGAEFVWNNPTSLPYSEDRVLLLGRKRS